MKEAIFFWWGGEIKQHYLKNGFHLNQIYIGETKKKEPHQTVRELSQKMAGSPVTVTPNLHSMANIQKKKKRRLGITCTDREKQTSNCCS